MRLWGMPKNYVNQKETHMNVLKICLTVFFFSYGMNFEDIVYIRDI